MAGWKPPRMWRKAGFTAVVAAWLLASCGQRPDRQPALGEAYAGPFSLPVREALVARAQVVDTLKHGERVELLGRRRSFYRIRTAKGAEGWVDGRHLLSAGDMEALRRLAERAAASPPQGAATVMDPLNVHTAPHRQAPSFRQILPEERADVIAYARVPRTPYRPAPLLAAKNGKGNGAAASRRKKKKQAEPLAQPPAPALPENWLELSRTQRAEEPAPPPAAAPPPTDEWALVRCKDGSAGWVLARMLYMAIPDEVAQYAERARIAAYFAIGAVKTKDGEKPVWLWAAQSQRQAEHDFDSLRIFVWSVKRNRWETAFIERGLKGYLPIELQRNASAVTGFATVVEEKDGRVVKRRYSLQAGNYRARLAGREEAKAPRPWLQPDEGGQEQEEEAPESPQTWTARLGGWIESLRARFSR
jgi:hypothetical protein